MEKNLSKSVSKKKVLILGASSDIGIKVVKKYLDNNWKVLAHANKNQKKLSLIKNQNLNIIKLDLSNPAKVENYIKKNQKLFSRIDSFISLTGLLKLSNYESFKIKDFLLHININYLANQFFIRKIIKNMKQKKWGRILTSSSIGTKFGGNKNTFLYSLSKHMNEFFPSVFKDLAKYNILVNCMQIGVTDTKINKIDKNKRLNKRAKLIPLKRIAKPEEIAKYIYFMGSDENTFITLQKINIAGGE
jgi:NAD(P)-dependent dehydrogenase (short-subunit alcohol dehydrogenase family)